MMQLSDVLSILDQKVILLLEEVNHMFKSYTQDTPSLILDTYLHLHHIAQQKPVNHLNSDTQFGKDKYDQKILIFEN